jgi:hypothetical protein
LHGTANSNGLLLIVPNGSGLKWVKIGGQQFDVAKTVVSPRGTVIACASYDCASQTITLDFSTAKPIDLTLAERHLGLPADGQKIVAARPKEAVPSQNGDSVVVMKKLMVR